MVVFGTTQLKPRDDDDDDDDDDHDDYDYYYHSSSYYYNHYYLPQKNKQINKEKRKNNWHPGWWVYPYIIHSNFLMLGSFCIGSLVAETVYICIIPTICKKCVSKS